MAKMYSFMVTVPTSRCPHLYAWNLRHLALHEGQERCQSYGPEASGMPIELHGDPGRTGAAGEPGRDWAGTGGGGRGAVGTRGALLHGSTVEPGEAVE